VASIGRRSLRAALVIGGGLAVVSGCRPPVPVAPEAVRDECAAPTRWNGAACVRPGPATDELARGTAALASFDVAAALPLLEAAAGHGPLRHDQHVQLHEQLGIAYAYLGRQPDAERAFERLLRLEPRHLLSYTLSPKATFVFERVRDRLASEPAPAMDVSWPRDLEVDRPLRFEVELEADPGGTFASAALTLREGAGPRRLVPVALPVVGGFRRIELPAPGGARPRLLEVGLTAYDSAGNEVYRWGDPRRPREVPIAYQPEPPWYRQWWVWAAGGTAAAVVTAGVVYAIVAEPEEIPGSFAP
jgi:tetratricopeptide (TPR) repeat protein